MAALANETMEVQHTHTHTHTPIKHSDLAHQDRGKDGARYLTVSRIPCDICLPLHLAVLGPSLPAQFSSLWVSPKWRQFLLSPSVSKRAGTVM